MGFVVFWCIKKIKKKRSFPMKTKAISEDERTYSSSFSSERRSGGLSK